MGMVEGYSGRLDAAEPHFRRAASLTSNNLIVPGLWLQAFVRNRTTADMRIALLIRDALLFDPDRLLDSPIPAPIAGHVLAKEAMSGLSRASELTIARLSSGQKAFLRWLEGRIGRNPLSQPLGSVLEQLALEADPVSQVLYAYALRDRGSLDQASQVLSRVLPLLDSQKGMLSSSWPWTYSGDVQFALGRFDAAVVSYQSAQTRNNADPGALLGMALIFRERGNFPQAESQLGEALRADPFFIPAVLRLSRFEWQAQALQR
jgi:tetratricopeptide (TPR) repeat protein